MKFLADEQFPTGAVQRLNLLGHDIVEVAADPGLVGQDEVDVLLPWAKRRHRILLSGDHIEDRDTRMRLNEHLRRTGRGRVIIVKKATTQPPLKTLAKLLYHLDEIETFFAGGHGEVRIGDFQNVRWFRPKDLSHVVRLPTEQGFQYVYKRRLLQQAPPNPNLSRQAPPKSPPASDRLIE